MTHYIAMIQRIRTEFPGFQIVERDESWLRIPFRILRWITRTDYDNFVTTIGQTIYVGPGWKDRSDAVRYRVLRHELVHLRQFQLFPLGPRFRWLNPILFSLCYLLVLPVFWTMRAKFEREAYTQSLLVQYELEGAFTDKGMNRNAESLVQTFAGPAYAWMATRRSTYRWAMETQRAINRGEIVNTRDRVSDLEAASGS